jgi:hypothetical protein
VADVDEVVRVVRRLTDRPRWKWSKEHRDDLRGERALPLLCLIGERDRTEAAAGALAARLRPDPKRAHRIPKRLVPSSSVDVGALDPGTGPDRPLLPLLNHLVRCLGPDRYGAGGDNPFHTFRLVDWLTRHTASTLERDHRAPLRSTLEEWYAPSKEGEGAADPLGPALLAAAPDKALALPALLPRLLSRLGRWLWLRGLLGGEPRWLMGQRFMVPAHSAGFLRFAQRLTVDRRDHEDPEQVKLLLVHAFLRDLRLFYGTRTWRVRRWRRTGYATVVLRGITEDNGGWELLRLINEVRNRTGEHDPLLVVATSERVPADLDLVPAPAGEVGATVEAWQYELPRNRQRFRPTARFVAVRLDDPPAAAPARHDEPWEPRRPPWFARRWFLFPVAVLLSALAATPAFVAWTRPDPCGASGFDGASVAWVPGTRECVGYSAGGYVFGSTDKLRRAQEAVFEQNAEAEALHRANPRRPVVSLVYFAELTHPDTREGTDDAEAEEVMGLLIQQSQANTVGNSTDDAANPLLRVVIANGGYQMKHARRAVDEFIAPLAERDPTVMGVVGGGRTVAETESAIGALGARGIPLLATTLTGESLPPLSPLYFQVVAGNGPQARMVAEYAAATGRTVTVYHPDLEREPDRYLRSLHDRFADLRRTRPWIGFRQWDSASTVQVDCRADDVAFYAGRETGFTDFLNTFLDSCPATAAPTLVGDDAVTRFIAQGESRRSDRFAGVSLGYVSLANRVVLAGASCVAEGKPAPVTDPDDLRPLNIFCAGLRGLYSPLPDRPAAWRAFGAELSEHDGNRRWTGERVGTAYDAAGVYLLAVVRNERRTTPASTDLPPNRAAVAQELRELDCSDPQGPACFKGVSGRIDFRAGRDGDDRPLAILTIGDITAMDANAVCTFRFQDTTPCP